MDLSLLLLFIPTFFVVSISPGMCMILSLNLGINIGIKRSLPMMYGELIGVGLVAACSLIGVSTIILTYPEVFSFLKVLGALYLSHLAINLWRKSPSLSNQVTVIFSKKNLFSQGFITATSNPKGWAFMLAILPPFINHSAPLLMQSILLITAMLIIEFISLIIYSLFGNILKQYLLKNKNMMLINKSSAIVYLLIAYALIFLQ